MASRIIQQPDNGPDLNENLDTGQGFLFLPDVTAVRGSNSIEQIASGSLNTLTLIEVVIDGDLQFWQLQSGAATADTENTVAPLDNAGIHWQRVGGFGAAMMAAARVTTASTVSLLNNTVTAISFDTERFNSGEWDSAVNPSRITALVDGIYSISGSVSFSSNATGQRKLAIRQNGATDIASEQSQATSSLPTNVTVATVTKMLAGDYVELTALQTSGGSLDILKTNQYSPELAAVRLAPFTDITNPFSGNPPPTPTPTPPGTTTTPFSVTGAGWYRVWQGEYPASTNFNIVRSDNGDGQTSDTVLDVTIIAGSPEGIINVTRNSIPNTASPSIDFVRVYHDPGVGLAYIEVHLLRGGAWTIAHSSLDDNYLDAPILESDFATSGLTTLAYGLKPNVTGGTGTIDVPQINSGGNKLLAPNAGVNWAAATGTPARTTFDTGAATLTQVAQRLMAVINDLITQGVFSLGVPATMTYANMLELAASLVAEGTVANVTDAFNITAAPDTTVQGIYTPVANFNSHSAYRIQGYEYETGNTRFVRWSTEHSTWTIGNASGNLYHSGATESTPWGVVQWKNESNSNVTVTITAPNLPFTYNALTDTHTAMVVTSSNTTGYEGLYLRGADQNSKRRYYLVGTSTNNKRIEWSGSSWLLKDDSLTEAFSLETVTYPDQVVTWTDSNGYTISVTGLSATNLMSGLSVGDVTSTYNGVYIPVQGDYNVLAGRKLIYRRDDGAHFIANSGSNWAFSDSLAGPWPIISDTDGIFPWNAAWTTANLTVQQNPIASAGWINGVSQGNITGNVTGNFHL
jgi:hypothetical protein